MHGYDPTDDITEKLQRAYHDARDVHEEWIADVCLAAKVEIERLRYAERAAKQQAWQLEWENEQSARDVNEAVAQGTDILGLTK